MSGYMSVCSIILHILSRCRNKQGSKYLVGSSNFVVYNGLKQFLKYCLFAFRWDICSTFVLILKSLIRKIDAFFCIALIWQYLLFADLSQTKRIVQVGQAKKYFDYNSSVIHKTLHLYVLMYNSSKVIRYIEKIFAWFWYIITVNLFEIRL